MKERTIANIIDMSLWIMKWSVFQLNTLFNSSMRWIQDRHLWENKFSIPVMSKD